MAYIPGPYDGGSLEAYLVSELNKVSLVLQLVEDNSLEVRHVAPEKPRNGLYFADGTDWNPGSGRGLYRFDEFTSTFVFLG